MLFQQVLREVQHFDHRIDFLDGFAVISAPADANDISKADSQVKGVVTSLHNPLVVRHSLFDCFDVWTDAVVEIINVGGVEVLFLAGDHWKLHVVAHSFFDVPHCNNRHEVYVLSDNI